MMPQNKGAAFLYAVVMGIGVACVIITLVVLLLRLIAGDVQAATLTTTTTATEVGGGGIPQHFERYPYIERELRALQRQRSKSTCNACVLEKYYSQTPEERLQQLRDTMNKYYPVKETNSE